MTELLNVDDVIARILRDMLPLPADPVPLLEALGRALAEDVHAGQDVPAFASSAMDGYAVRAADVAGASHERPARLRVVADIPAGVQPDMQLGPGEAARIMTGAPLPEGADAVIRVEDTGDRWVSDGLAALPETVDVFVAARPGTDARQPGETVRAGALVLARGAVLRAQDLGLLASLGYAAAPVTRRPRVAVLSTGTELVEPGQSLRQGQIYNSNGVMLAALVTEAGGEPIVLPVARDTVSEVRGCFDDALAQQPDILISSAGVSVGTHDVVRTVIESLGRLELWRVNIRPGKPLAYGDVGGVPFFGLPGNPVSAMVTFEVFVRPALDRLRGLSGEGRPVIMASLGHDLPSDGRRSYLRVRLDRDAGGWVAHTIGMQSSAELLALAQADGLMIIPEGLRHVPAGGRYPVRLLRSLPASD